MDAYEKLYQIETTPEALSASSDYLAGKLCAFVNKNEPVLICFPSMGPDSLGAVIGEAVVRCGAKPVFWGPDFRWKELLRLAFDTHAHTVIAPPLVILGLMKLSRTTSTPLYIRNVVLGGYPYARWMLEGLKKGLDCRIWGFYAVRSGPVILGFTCDQEAGIHARDEIIDVRVLDEKGDHVPPPGRGRMYFASRKDTAIVYDPEETAIVHHQPCSCGSDSPRIVETVYVGSDNPTKHMLEQHFLDWTSVLDYRATQTESGIDLELVVFPGVSLPKLPSCAKLTVRHWNPEEDIPFYMADNFMKIPEIYW